jgi:hypothetical protein
VENIPLCLFSHSIHYYNNFNRAFEENDDNLLFVCNVKLISIELLMVENGTTLMKLLKLDGVMEDKRGRVKWLKAN